jgi:hypothetical protein
MGDGLNVVIPSQQVNQFVQFLRGVQIHFGERCGRHPEPFGAGLRFSRLRVSRQDRAQKIKRGIGCPRLRDMEGPRGRPH